MNALMVLLLSTIGPMLVGFDLVDDDDDPEDEVPIEPVEIVDLPDPVDPVVPPEPDALPEPSERIADARNYEGDIGPFNALRGTDQDETFVGLDDASNVFDTSGGNDTVTGGLRDDTLIGGEASDLISGGDGDDAIFGGFHRATRADDLDADTLAGGAGDDTLFLGDDDVATGDEGADLFVVLQDATASLNITDFDPDEDALVVETTDPETAELISQVVTADGLELTLSTGAIIRLDGLTSQIDPASILFLSVSPLDSAG